MKTASSSTVEKNEDDDEIEDEYDLPVFSFLVAPPKDVGKRKAADPKKRVCATFQHFRKC